MLSAGRGWRTLLAADVAGRRAVDFGVAATSARGQGRQPALRWAMAQKKLAGRLPFLLLLLGVAGTAPYIISRSTCASCRRRRSSFVCGCAREAIRAAGGEKHGWRGRIHLWPGRKETRAHLHVLLLLLLAPKSEVSEIVHAILHEALASLSLPLANLVETGGRRDERVPLSRRWRVSAFPGRRAPFSRRCWRRAPSDSTAAKGHPGS